MSQQLADILSQTSEPVVDNAPVQNVPETTSTPAPDTTPTSQDVELPDNIRTYLEQNPDHKQVADVLNREFQRHFTPRLQQAAELQKLVDGVDPQAIQTLRQLQQLAETNPEYVAQWYRSQADLFHPQQTNNQPFTAQPPTNPDPFEGIEPVTDAEALLLQQARQQWQWQKDFEAKQQQQVLQAKATQVKSERNALQQEFGVVIPDTELAQVWNVAENSGLSIRQAYLALNNERLLPTLLQRARDEASGVVQNKLNLSAGNPGGITPRQTAPNNAKGTLQDYFSEAMK